MSSAPLRRARLTSPPRTSISGSTATATACVNMRAGSSRRPEHTTAFTGRRKIRPIFRRSTAAEDADLAGRSGEKPEPYNGYYFRILTAQGPAAPGGAFSYLINGHMIAGHAMVAWPAAYGDSGVETFICGENGVVFQKDLGPNTAALGASMAQFNPDGTWKVVE